MSRATPRLTAGRWAASTAPAALRKSQAEKREARPPGDRLGRGPRFLIALAITLIVRDHRDHYSVPLRYRAVACVFQIPAGPLGLAVWNGRHTRRRIYSHNISCAF